MADTAVQTAERTRAPGASRVLYNTFIRNLSAKIAAAPMVLTVLVVFIGCTIWTVYYSFTASRLLPSNKLVGFDQYERLFSTARWNVSVTNLIIYGSLSLVFTLVIGFVLAVLMDQKIRFESAFRTIMLYPFALSFIVTGLVWQWIMNPTLGLQGTLRNMGWANFTFDWLNNPKMVLYAILIAGLWQGVGFTMVLLLAGLRSVDEEIWKAARIDGIPTWRVYVSVVLPMMGPSIGTALVLLSVGVVKVFDVVVAMTQGGPGLASEVPAKFIIDNLFGRANIGLASAASTVLLITVLAVLAPWLYARQRKGSSGAHA
jgi:glucose/mannose transport system permease protein